MPSPELVPAGPRLNGDAFVYDHGVITQLDPTREFRTARATDINDSGEVVVTSELLGEGQQTWRAFVHSRGCFAACCD